MNEGISTFELVELIAIFSGQLDSLFSYWISASFAVLISTYAGKDHFNFAITLSISILYLMASMMFLARFSATANFATYYMELGRDILPPNVASYSIFIGITRIPTFVIGFIITEIYLWHTYLKSRKADDPADT